VFDVFSVKRMYNIKVSTGKNTWFLVKIDDDDDELDYSFLNIMSLVQPLSSASSMVSLKLSALIVAPPGQTGRQRQCVLNLFDSLSVHPSVTKLVKTIFWKWLNKFDANWHKWSTGKGVKRSALRSVGQRSRSDKQKIDCSRHCKCWPWKGSHGAVHRFSCPRMAGERLADALVWFCMDCCMLYSLLLYVVDLWTVVTLSTTSWNTNFTASFCAGLTNPISGVYRISVRRWGWSPPQINSFWPQNDKSGCTLRQYGTDRKHGQSL